MSTFIHLHNHTHYSLQDAACTVESLVDAAVRNEMPAVALTDHGVLFGIPEFYSKAKKKGIKPVVGMEAYINLESDRFDRKNIQQYGGKKPYYHLVLIAKDAAGYKNLVKLSTFGFTEGFYYRPRIDFELLKKYKDGIICTSACLGGIVSRPLVMGDYEKARKHAQMFQDLFQDDFYLELQDHNVKEDMIILEQVPKLSRELGIKMVATNDCHYINKEDSIGHNILLLFADKTGEVDYKKLRYGTDEIYFKSVTQMKALFQNYEGAVENTVEIADKTDINLEVKGYFFPKFPIPDDSTETTLDGYFRSLALEGLQQRYSEITPEIEARFNYEVDTIINMGFSGYFLIVQDFIRAAKRRGIPVGPGRGSAAGSVVAYALEITNVDPLPYNLLFERFLNPARVTMPDIDVDFADDQRGEVIDYVKQKYGEECVSQIVTFNTLSSKAVVRDVARVLNIPLQIVNSITKFIPTVYGKNYSLQKAIDEVPELKWVKESTDPKIAELIKYSKFLEGLNRNVSKHAAGVVITPGDVSDYVPLSMQIHDQKDTGSAQKVKELVTQYKMKELEDAGLLKMDFLGLRTLTIIKDTIRQVEENYNVTIDIDAIPLNDAKTYEVFSKGQTTGIFQFESPPMREYLKRLKPDSILDLTAMNALYRPGPMDFIDDFIARRFGKQEVTFLHEKLEPILKETYGIIVYQEQVIQIANQVVGMTLAEADLLRRAMGKKDDKAMMQQRVKFIEGAAKNNINKDVAGEIFSLIEKFAQYGFNKSHAVAYSIVAYQTAYLKAHYPAEFMAANLTNEFGDQTKVTKFLEDCRKMKIPVLPPDVNKPSVFFKVEKKKIKFGLSAIKNVGVGAVEEILRVRESSGKPFESIYDFCARCNVHIVNKRAIEGLVLAGAFDALHKNRRQLFESVSLAIEFGSRAARFKEEHSAGLFGEIEEEGELTYPELPQIEDWSEKDRLEKEREVTGFYISNHPLRRYELEYYSFATIQLGETQELKDDETVRACGVLIDLTIKYDKRGGQYAVFKLNDLTGSCDCMMFAKSYEKNKEFVEAGETVMCIGKTESSGDAVKLHIEEVIPMSRVQDRFTKFVMISLDKEKNNEAMGEKLSNILAKHPGNTFVLLELTEGGTRKAVFHIRKFRVKLSDKLIKELIRFAGEDAISLVGN